MLLQAFLVGLAAAIGQSDYLLGTAMVERPIVLGAIVGIFLGDIPTGVIVGFQLELAFMGVWQVGAAVPPNVIVGSVLGTAFAITMGAGPETALTIAMPTAVLAACLTALCIALLRLLWLSGLIVAPKKTTPKRLQPLCGPMEFSTSLRLA